MFAGNARATTPKGWDDMETLLGDATRAAMGVFARLLAGEVNRVESNVSRTASASATLAEARQVLHLIDQLDVGNEADDRAVEAVRLGGGAEWLVIAESGSMGLEFVAHVLHYATMGAAGYSGGKFVQCLLRTIEAASEEQRDALAMAAPEYVGLWRACATISDAETRLRERIGGS